MVEKLGTNEMLPDLIYFNEIMLKALSELSSAS